MEFAGELALYAQLSSRLSEFLFARSSYWFRFSLFSRHSSPQSFVVPELVGPGVVAAGAVGAGIIGPAIAGLGLAVPGTNAS